MGNKITAIQNLKKKGADANPNGRPKREWTVQGLIEQAMEEEDETGIPFKKAVYSKLVKLAVNGDVVAIKELNNRLDGMATQKTDITTDGQPIKLNIIAGGGYVPEPVEIDATPEKGTV